MPNVTRKWKKLLAVGCSHGNMIDPEARKAVLDFRDKWKPDSIIHLGDFVDTACFRQGAKGTSDESEPIAPDFEEGLRFLKDLRPSLIFNGNHEARLWRFANHHNAIIQELSKDLIDRIRTRAALCKAEFVEGWSIRDYRTIGNFKFMHGYMYGENACRDHAEAHGNIVFAHTHRAGMAKGRRDDSSTGYCVGTLSSIPAMEYAGARRSTLSWAGGFVWGYYTDTRCVLWLHEQPQSQKEWILPL
jgi:hypothetical protein